MCFVRFNLIPSVGCPSIEVFGFLRCTSLFVYCNALVVMGFSPRIRSVLPSPCLIILGYDYFVPMSINYYDIFVVSIHLYAKPIFFS